MSQSDIVEYYSEAGQDYSAWSPAFNMHFGYYRKWMNPFRLEPMLEQMNAEILSRMTGGKPAPEMEFLDAGCGLGATARHIARESSARVLGITIVPWQIEEAGKLAARAGLSDRITFDLRDYRDTKLPANQFDGVYALESSCYAGAGDKADFIRESFRLLKRGGRLVVADGFLSRLNSKPNPIYRKCLSLMEEFWALETFAHKEPFLAALEKAGYRDIQIENANFRIAPSVGFIPWVTAKFFVKDVFAKRRKLTRRQLGNALAPILGLIVGLHMHRFSYCIVTARRP